MMKRKELTRLDTFSQKSVLHASQVKKRKFRQTNIRASFNIAFTHAENACDFRAKVKSTIHNNIVLSLLCFSLV